MLHTVAPRVVVVKESRKGITAHLKAASLLRRTVPKKGVSWRESTRTTIAHLAISYDVATKIGLKRISSSSAIRTYPVQHSSPPNEALNSTQRPNAHHRGIIQKIPAPHPYSFNPSFNNSSTTTCVLSLSGCCMTNFTVLPPIATPLA